MFDYIVMNAEGFRGAARGELISFVSVEEVNGAIEEGAELALPHAAPDTQPPPATERED